MKPLIQLKQQGLNVQANLAGDSFQNGYREQLEQLLKQHNLEGSVQFVGQLERQALARFYALHHVGVFPSIHPEAFGIVAAEMMASGLVVVSSGVGGASELIEDGRTGLLFQAGDSQDLARCLISLARDTALLKRLRQAGKGSFPTLQRTDISNAWSWLQQNANPQKSNGVLSSDYQDRHENRNTCI